jgi:hypothetical protein
LEPQWWLHLAVRIPDDVNRDSAAMWIRIPTNVNTDSDDVNKDSGDVNISRKGGWSNPDRY